MANYSLVINSKFRPFTYDELMKPVHDSTAAHQEIETAYGALDTQAAKWEHLANQQTDEKAYTMYKNYADDLRAQADNLAKNGLNVLSRKDLLTMQKRYAQEITPIENAYTRRATLADEQRQAKNADNTIMFERDANTISLDKFIEDPMYDYGNRYSGAAITKSVSDAVSNIAKTLRNYSTSKLDDYTNIFRQNYGISVKEAQNFINALNNRDFESPAYQNALGQIVNSVIGKTGISSWENSKEMLPLAYNAAAEGIWSALGESKLSTYENAAAKIAAQNGGNNPPEEKETFPYQSRAHMTQAAIEAKRKLADKNSKYTIKDEKTGTYKLTDEAKALLSEDFETLVQSLTVPPKGSIATSSMAIENRALKGMANKFKKTLAKAGINVNTSIDNIETELNKFMTNTYSTPDAVENPEYYIPIAYNDRKAYTDIINETLKKAGDVSYVAYNPETGKYEKTKDSWTAKNVEDFVVTDIGFDKDNSVVNFYNPKTLETFTVEYPYMNSAFDTEGTGILTLRQQISDLIADYQEKVDQDAFAEIFKDSYNARIKDLVDLYYLQLQKPFETVKTTSVEHK